MDPIFLVPVVLVLAAIAYTIIINKRYQASKADVIIEQERGNYSSYKDELLNEDFSFLRDWMKDKPIDAFTSASVPQSKTNKVQTLIGDGLKNLALSGIGVRLRRVETDAFWVLSGKDLHFLTTDVDGDLEEHIIFNSNRIGRAHLQDTGVLKTNLGFYAKQAEEYLPKVHLITFDIDGEELALEIHDRLRTVVSSSDMFNQKKNLQLMAKCQVVGEKFLTELRSRYSNL